MQQNLAVLALVVVLLVLGAWMIERLRIYSRTMACVETGHRSCLKLDIDRTAPR
jgi:cytochrome oxidase assembly protein ShyY1